MTVGENPKIRNPSRILQRPLTQAPVMKVTCGPISVNLNQAREEETPSPEGTPLEVIPQESDSLTAGTTNEEMTKDNAE